MRRCKLCGGATFKGSCIEFGCPPTAQPHITAIEADRATLQSDKDRMTKAPVEQKDLGNCFKCGNALSVYCSYCNTPEAAPKPTIPADEREEVALAIKHCFDTGKTRFDQITDAAIRTLISLGWKK